MNRTKLLAGAIGGAAFLSFAQIAPATTQTRIDYNNATSRATAVYKDASAKCAPMTGHEKDMCAVEAKATEKRSKAAAEATYKGTIKAKTASRIANADADFMVAKVACDTRAGQEKDVCVKQAEATHVKLVADAKANKTAVDARADAREDTRDAQFKVAMAKCDAVAGTEKDMCVTSAKSTYGK
jgi:hypothetical protein